MATSKEIRVGAFVLAGLIVAGIVIFLIGDEKRMFDAKVTYHTSFNDVQGLKTGAPIRMGGVDIGTVAKVGHGQDPADSKIYVELKIVRRESARIRQDTIARVQSKGLLGDKMIELTAGSAAAAALPPGSFIPGEEPSDFTAVFSQVTNMTKRAEQILANLEITSRTLASAEVQEDLRGSAHFVNLLLKQVTEGQGYVHKFLTDPNEAERVSRLVAAFDKTAAGAEGTLAELQKAATRVNTGPGFVHEILYGESSAESLANFGSAAAELASTLRGIRGSNSVAHSLLYGGGGETQSVIRNLEATTENLRQITADVRAGKGTLGALLVDPTLYEDAKSILGNVERNAALRALVRYSIKQDEKVPGTPVAKEAPTPAK